MFNRTQTYKKPPVNFEPAAVFTFKSICAIIKKRCGHSSLVEYQLPKLRGRVRFPLSAPFFCLKMLKQHVQYQVNPVMLLKLLLDLVSANTL